MYKRVLILNADYLPICTCTVFKAMKLVFKDKADVIEVDDLLVLRSVNFTYSYPVVIRIKKFVKVPYKRIPLNKDNVFKRDGYKCVYCGSKSSSNNPLTWDHVKPKCLGGLTSWDNLVTSCKKCNEDKGSLTVEEAGLEKPTAFKPSFFTNTLSNPKWNPYLLY